MDRLLGRRSLVTGASSGIGKSIALAFAREGAGVAACGQNPLRTQVTRDAVAAEGVRAVDLVGDVACEDDVRRIVAGAVAALGGLDIVVNCAGVSELDGFKRVHETSTEAWDRTLAVNVRGPFLVSKHSIPHLLAAGGGALLHIGSVCALTVWAGNGAYGVSKAGLTMLSDHLAVEYAPGGIRSNTLLPGEIATVMSERAISLAPDPGTYREGLLRRHPVGRFGTVEEVAAAAVFLCSDEARFMTGANVPIDGAYSRV